MLVTQSVKKESKRNEEAKTYFEEGSGGSTNCLLFIPGYILRRQKGGMDVVEREERQKRRRKRWKRREEGELTKKDTRTCLQYLKKHIKFICTSRNAITPHQQRTKKERVHEGINLLII